MKTIALIITALVAIACGTDPVSTTATESTFDSCATTSDCSGAESCNSQGVCVLGGQDGAMGNSGTNGTNGKDGKDGVNGASFKSCPTDWTCADGESCSSQGICVPKTVAIVVAPDNECQADAQCTNGPAYCENGNIYYSQGQCASAGTCYQEKLMLQACTYGCTDGTGCNSAPNPACTVGAGCDDGNPNTTFDRYNAACTCVGTATSAPACDDFNPCTQGTTFVNGLCAGGTPNPGIQCDDGNGLTTNDVCGNDGVCRGTLPVPAPHTFTLRVKPGFQFIGLVGYPDANNGWPIGEWTELGSEVTWEAGKVFGFNVVTTHEGPQQDWVGHGNVDGQGNLCSGAAPQTEIIPQGFNPKWTLNEVFDGTKPADLGGTFGCSPGGWVDWLMPSPL